MADSNHTPKAYLHSLTLDLSGQNPREIRSTAMAMIQAVELGLFEERRDEPRTLESAERDSLIGLLVAARSMIDAADEIDQAQRRLVAA